MKKFIYHIRQLQKQKKQTKTRIYFTSFGILVFLAVLITLPIITKQFINRQKISKSQASNTLTQGLEGWWTFDTADMDLTSSTAEVLDRSGNARNGDWQNDARTTVPGAIGQAIWFDGINDDVEIADNNAFSPGTTGAFSVSAWVNLDTLDPPDGIAQEFVSKGNGGGYEWSVGIQSLRVYFTMFTGPGGEYCAAKWTPPVYDTGQWYYLIPGRWYHITGVYTGTDCLLYENGVLKSSGNTISESLTNTTAPVRIGRRADNVRQTKGAVDDVRIYNRALSNAEVTQLYQLSPYTIAVAPLPPRYHTQKKVIESGYGQRTAAQLLNEMPTVAQHPVNGIVFNSNWPSNTSSIFSPVPITQSDLDLSTLSQINWASSLTDNFIFSWVVGSPHADFFDDAQWANVTANARLLSQAVQTARVKGIYLDMESYGSQIWSYNSTLYPNHTFAEVQAKYRQRGKEFIQAIATSVPDIKLFCTYLYSYSAYGSHGDITQLSTAVEALLKSFADGMLEGAGPQVTIVEGNENTYYWPDTINWLDWMGPYYNLSDIRGYIAPELQSKALTNLQMGTSVWYPSFKPISDVLNQRKLEHNMYYGLLNSDEYTLFNQEESGSTWWTNPVPPEVVTAFNSARNKISQGQALGFTIAGNGTTINYSTGLQMTTPSQNQSFTTNQPVQLTASAAAGINNVTLFGYKPVTTVNSAPFTYNAGTLPAGTYLAYATANNYGIVSNPVTFTVSDPSPTPTLTLTPTNTPTPTTTPTSTPTPTATPTSTPSPTNTPTPTPTSIPTPTPSLDKTPPTVSITYPANNATVYRNSNVTITANASDNIGVAKVEFRVNNTLKCTDTTSPYSCVWKVPNVKNVQYTLSAKAYDAAGNPGTNSILVTTK